MKIKGKRILKNGVVAGYVLQKNGTWRWRFIKGPSKKKGGQNIQQGRLHKLINGNQKGNSKKKNFKNLSL